MGWYFRKSMKMGPLRLNFSKSGVGVSTGVKGFRVGTGPRGAYVQAGWGGLYYRQSLGPGRQRAAAVHHRGYPLPAHEIQTGVGPAVALGSHFAALEDSSADEFLQDFNKRASSWPLATLGVLAPGLVLCSLLPHPASAVEFWIMVPLAIGAYIYDQRRQRTTVEFQLEPSIEKAWAELGAACQQLAAAGKLRHVVSTQAVHDGRYHAGVSALTSQKQARVASGNVPRLRTSAPVPNLIFGSNHLVFMPDRVLFMEGKYAHGLTYEEIRVDVDSSRYVEQEAVPRDAEVIGHTWRFVNRDGSPDRRFKENRQIPVCRYEYGRFSAASGLSESFLTSACGAIKRIQVAMAALAKAQQVARVVESSGLVAGAAPPSLPAPEPMPRKPALAPPVPRMQPPRAHQPQLQPADIPSAPAMAWATQGITVDGLKLEIQQIRAARSPAWVYRVFTRSLMQAVLRAAPLRDSWAAGSRRGDTPADAGSFMLSIGTRAGQAAKLVESMGQVLGEQAVAPLSSNDEAAVLGAVARISLAYARTYEDLMRWAIEQRSLELSYPAAAGIAYELAATTTPAVLRLEAFALEARNQVDSLVATGHGSLTLAPRLEPLDLTRVQALVDRVLKNSG